MADTTRSEEPIDRLTRICDAMATTMETHAEHSEGDKAIVMLDSETMGAMHARGYDNEEEVLVALLMQVRAVLRSRGQDLSIVPIPLQGSGRMN